VAGIGPFFAVATGPAPVGGGWVPLSALQGAPTANDPLTARIAAVRVALGTDTRVAASTAFQGLAAQLVAPLFAAAVVTGALPAAADGLAAALHWRPDGVGPGLWWGTPGRIVAAPGAAALCDVLLGLLAPLVGAVRGRASVAERVLWGDAASAVASARRLVAADRPAAASRATDLARDLLTRAPLAATAVLRAPEPPDRGWTFRRRSCCLYYRVAGAGVCDDCVLLDRPPRGG
jgi:ferric iron reductase protein FhuF